MSTDIIMQREGSSLIPTDKFGIDAVANIAFGCFVRVVITQPRNIKFHRLFFGLVNLVFENQTQFATRDGFLDALKVSVGHCDDRSGINGKQFIVPRSISFAAMDNEQFRQFYDQVLTVILEKILPNTNKKELEQQLFDILKEPGPNQLERV